MEFQFSVDRKITTWERCNFTIKAETYEQAEQRIKQITDEDEWTDDEFDQCETLYDCNSQMTVEENEGNQVIEILFERKTIDYVQPKSADTGANLV